MSAVDTSAEIGPGKRFGPFTIVRLVGKGGMAEVFEAVQRNLKRRVAVKVLSTSAAERSDLRARFMREGEAAARLRHRNVVEIYDVGTIEGRPYIVMEFLDGETLQERIFREGAMETEDIAKLMLPVITAVAAAHDRGIVHRDLKPENIILAELDSGIEPKVLDFGISRVATSRLMATVESTQVGTPHYMSPEHARGEETDARADQYALGVILYELATGVLPRDHDSVLTLLRMVGSEGFPPPTARLPTVDARLEKVILRAMSAKPDDRYSDNRDFALELSKLAAPDIASYWKREFSEMTGAVSNPPPPITPAPVVGEEGAASGPQLIPVEGQLLDVEEPEMDDVDVDLDDDLVQEETTFIPPATPSVILSKDALVPEQNSSKKVMALALGVVIALVLGALAWKFMTQPKPVAEDEGVLAPNKEASAPVPPKAAVAEPSEYDDDNVANNVAQPSNAVAEPSNAVEPGLPADSTAQPATPTQMRRTRPSRRFGMRPAPIRVMEPEVVPPAPVVMEVVPKPQPTKVAKMNSNWDKTDTTDNVDPWTK